MQGGKLGGEDADGPQRETSVYIESVFPGKILIESRAIVEHLDEQIHVIARFRDGKFEPMRFLWNGRQHRVEQVTGRWASRRGNYNVYSFSVINENGTYFEISMNTKDMDWRLDRMTTE